MNNDTNQPQGSQPVGGSGLPPSLSVPETPAAPILTPIPPTPPEAIGPAPLPEIPTPTLVEPAVVPTPEPLTEIPTGLAPMEPIAPPTSPIEEKPNEEAVKPVKPKRKINKKLVIGGTLVLLLIGGAVALASQFGLFRGDIRPRAATSCRDVDLSYWDCGGTGTGNYPTCTGGKPTFHKRIVQQCTTTPDQPTAAPQPTSAPQPTAAPQPTSAPPSSGGCTPGSCTYYSCTQQLVYNSSCGRDLASGFCGTNYPSGDPCGRGGSVTPAPTAAVPTVTAAPGTGGGGGRACSGTSTCSGIAAGTCNAGYKCVDCACGSGSSAYACFKLDSSCGAATICTPWQIVNAGGGNYRRCNSAGTGWDECGTSPTCSGGTGGTPTPTATPVPTITGYTGNCSTVSGDAVCRSKSVGTACSSGFVGGVSTTTKTCQATGTTGTAPAIFPVCTCEAVAQSTTTTVTPTVTITPIPTPAGTCSCNYGSKVGEVGPYSCKDTAGTITFYQPTRADCIGTTSIAGTGGATGPGSQTQTSCGNSGQSCCVPENFPGQSVNICNAGLYCNGGTCSTSAAVCGGTGGTGAAATSKCKVFKCGSKCNAGNQCTAGAGEADCSSANLGGECGQIDYIGDTGGYCGVMVQNCYGSCAGEPVTVAPPGTTGAPPGDGTQPPTATTTATGTPPAEALACVNTRIFINGSTTVATAEQMNAIKIGDTIRMMVQGNSPSLVGAKFVVKIDGADVSNGGFGVTNYLTPIQASGVKEYYYDYPISRGGAYSIEGAVNSVAPTVTATPIPTTIATSTPTVTVAPGGVYGNGADGACTASGSVNLTTGSCTGKSTADAVNFRMTASVAAGANSVTLASTPSGLAGGDEILIIALQGPGSGVGDYETAYTTGISGNTLTLDKSLAKAYDGTANKIMVQRVPHYTTVNVGGTLTAGGFSCSSFLGGVLSFRANGAVNVASGGAIDMNGKGFAGGSIGDQIPGQQGVSQLGCGINAVAANGGGGGGGGANAWNADPGNGAGAGGGGYGTAGGAGGNSSEGNPGGAAGAVYGVADLTSKLFLGSGGGEGGNEANGPSGNGGGGGGIVAIFADSLTVAGKLASSGVSATTAYNNSGGGGGGGGGSILLYGKNLTLGASLVKADGGVGSAGGPSGNAVARGGNGGVGRISVRYETNSTGTTAPTANSAALTLLPTKPAVAGASSDRGVMFLIEKLIKLIRP